MTTTWSVGRVVLVNGYVFPAVEYTLTDEHSASSCGQPVLLISIEGQMAGVYGPCDVLPDTSGGLLGPNIAGRMVTAELYHQRVSGPLAEQFARAWRRTL